MATGEQAVRTYLRALADPASVQPDTSEFDTKIEASNDPIERLQLHAEKAQALDPMPAIRLEFIDRAKTWADHHGIGHQPFLDEGTHKDDLAAAGFLVKGRKSTTSKPRRSRVSVEEVVAALPPKGQTFTVKSLQEASGGSPATVRKVIDAAIEDGHVEDHGADPDHSSRGRAPTLYEVK